MYFLRKIAWKILDKELQTNWIHRSGFNEYSKWMSRDFKVMIDMYEFFREKPYGNCGDIESHRKEMFKKYKGYEENEKQRN